MGFFADLLIRIGGDAEDLKKSLSGARRDLQSWGRDLENIGRTMTAAITLPLVGVGAAAIKVAGELEQNSIAFKTMLGSADAAQKHLNELKDFALKTPFQFNDLVTASKRMQALGFDAKAVIPALRNIGDAAAALGMGAEGIQRIVTALGQMKAKGTVQAEEMRQLAEAGIPAWQILAKTLNTDVAGAMKLVEKRAVDAAKAVPALLAGINEKFGGLMEAQSKTFMGQLSNLKDALTFTLQDIGKTLLPIAKNIMESVFQPMLEMLKNLAAGFAAMPQSMQTVIIAVGGLAAALGPLGWVLGGVVSGFGTLISLALKLPALLNPVTLGIAALGTAAGIAFYELNRSSAKTAALDKDFGEWITKQIKETKDYAATREMLNQALEKGAIGASQYQQALVLLEDREKKTFGEAAQGMLKDFGITIETVTDKEKRGALASAELAKAANLKIDAWEAMEKRYERYAETVERETKRLLAADEELQRSYLYGKAVFQATHDAIQRKAQQTVEIIVPLYERIGRAFADAISLNTARGVGQYSGAAGRQIEIVSAGWSETLKKMGREMSDFQKEIDREARRAFDSVARHMARNIVEWKGWKDSVLQIGKDLATGFLEIMIRQLLKPLEEQFAKLAGKLAGWLGSLIGGGGGAASTAAGASASTAGAGVSAAGGVASAAVGAASGVWGIVGAVGAVGTMISSVIGNFQSAKMETTLNAIEKSTRYLDINFATFFTDVALNYMPYLQLINEAIYTHIMPAFAELITVSKGGQRSLTFTNCTFNGVSQANVNAWMSAAMTEAAAAGA